jgi:hypothetical protein
MSATTQALLPLVLGEESAVLIRWQTHCPSLAVELRETVAGWHCAASWNRPSARVGVGGLCDIERGPYVSRVAAIRNTVAHLVHRARHMGMTSAEAVRLYRAAGVPVPAQWQRAGLADVKKKHGLFTHRCPGGGEWLALSLPECCAALEGHTLTDAERTDGALLLMGYARLLEEAGLVEQGHRTEQAAVDALLGRMGNTRNTEASRRRQPTLNPAKNV